MGIGWFSTFYSTINHVYTCVYLIYCQLLSYILNIYYMYLYVDCLWIVLYMQYVFMHVGSMICKKIDVLGGIYSETGNFPSPAARPRTS